MSVIPDLQYLGSTEGLGGDIVTVSLHYVGGDPGQERHGVQDGAVRHTATLGLSEISMLVSVVCLREMKDFWEQILSFLASRDLDNISISCVNICTIIHR